MEPGWGEAGSGDRTQLFMYKGQKSLLSSNAESMVVNQDKSGIISWRIWRKAMKLWVDETTLCQPLGKWYKSGNDLDWTWTTFMQQGQCLIATDGSASNNMMSFA
eukprot:4097562-Ditylum_brightwellii.AAC.1